jgi:hypothetical protein
MTGATGGCHCGTVRFAMAAAAVEATRCTCSICTKMGSLCTYCPPGDFRVTAGEEALSVYSWGDRMLDFRFCSICSCMVHWRVKPERFADAFGDGPGKVGVNARLLDGFVEGALRVRVFEGNTG